MSKISHIIKKLMFDKQLRTNELARLTNIPQPTLHRLVEGETINPNISVIKALADFFSLTTAQLLGNEPILWLPPLNKIPILKWNELYNWISSNREKKFSSQIIYTEAPIGINAFAVVMNDSSMEPNFPKNTILIFDQDKPISDKCFALVQSKQANDGVIFRQLLFDNNQIILVPLSLGINEFKIVVMNKNEDIIEKSIPKIDNKL